MVGGVKMLLADIDSASKFHCAANNFRSARQPSCDVGDLFSDLHEGNFQSSQKVLIPQRAWSVESRVLTGSEFLILHDKTSSRSGDFLSAPDRVWFVEHLVLC
jgi:hypothetical protein